MGNYHPASLLLLLSSRLCKACSMRTCAPDPRIASHKPICGQQRLCARAPSIAPAPHEAQGFSSHFHANKQLALLTMDANANLLIASQSPVAPVAVAGSHVTRLANI